MSSFLEDIEFASKVNEAIKEAELRGIDNSVELTKEMIKKQYGDVEKLQQENQDLRKALKVYEEGKYQEHLKIQMAIDYIKENRVDLSWFMTTDKNLKIEGISNVVSTFRLLEILGGKENER